MGSFVYCMYIYTYIGRKEEITRLERQFFSGIYTPFETGSRQDDSNGDEQQAVVEQKISKLAIMIKNTTEINCHCR